MTKRKPMRMLITVGIAITMLFAMVVLGGCSDMIRIADFTEFENLPRNPSRAVFVTDFGEGEHFEVDVPSEDIGAVMDKLFARTFERMAGNTNIDVLNESLRIYDQEDSYWVVPIGVINHNNRWYKPSQDGLRTMLYELANASRAGS